MASVCPPKGNVVGSTAKPSTGPKIDVQTLGQKLRSVIADVGSEPEAIQRLLELAASLTRSVATLYFPLNDDSQLSAEPYLISDQQLSERTIDQLYSLALATQSSQQAQAVRPQFENDVLAIAVPVLSVDRPAEVLISVVQSAEEPNRLIAGVAQLLQFLAAYAASWRGKLLAHEGSRDVRQRDRLLAGLARAYQKRSFTASVDEIAESLRSMRNCRQVAIGRWSRGGSCRLIAVSGKQAFSRGSELVKRMEAVLAETVLRDRHAEAEPGQPAPTQSTRELLEQSDAASIRTVALPDYEGKPYAACLFVEDDPTSADTDFEATLRQNLGGQIKELHRANKNPLPRWYAAYRRISSRHRTLGLLLVTTLIAATLFVPLPYWLRCSCELQPLTRRFVAAPYEGTLEAAFVRPGDYVEKGQLLARMDAKELRIELAGLEADLQRATKQRDTAMATRDHASVQLATYEMERLRSEQQLVRKKMDQLEIKSPTDGVVIIGDPSKLEGARLSMGQSLLEVGPLRDMVAEVLIPAEDISHVDVGDPVTLRLEAVPGERLPGNLVNIHPRTEERDGQYVFVGEVEFDRADLLLRPGMRGRARVHVDNHPLVWILFRRAWESILFRLG